MNTTKFLTLLNKTVRFNTKNMRLTRVLQQLDSRKMSSNVSTSQTQTEKEVFQDVLSGIINMFVTNPKFAEVPDVANWIKQVLDYNLTGGKKARGLTTVLAYEMLEEPEKINEETLKLARILGWCVEMAYLLVLDDIMDGSSTRRGVPCWYMLPDVGLGAINDAILIYSSLFDILRTHFGDSPQYNSILNLFNELLLFTSIGQHLDYTMAKRNKNDYSAFTIEKYNAIVKYKTAYYTFKLPVCLGLLLANNNDKEIHKKVEGICLEIGRFFQIQDDFIDCYGDEAVTGKAGTDIQEGKCSWLAVMALQRCNAEQRIEFVECYGSKQPEHVKRVKRLYNQLQLPELYMQQERAQYDAIVRQAHALPNTLSPTLFLKLINTLYKRQH